MFDFTIDESSIGQTIGPTDGFLVNLIMTAPPVHEVPRWDEGKLRWVAGYFTLRGSRDVRDLYCSQTGFATNVLVRNHSLGYRGDLAVVSAPRGSTWSITLADAPNPRVPLPTPGWAPTYQFAGGFGYKFAPPPREPAMVERR